MKINQHQINSEKREECENSEKYSDPRSHSSFYKNRNDKAIQSISDRLENLPQVNVSSGFDQRMAALFALELELEIKQKSASLLLRNSKINLPDIITDIRKEFS